MNTLFLVTVSAIAISFFGIVQSKCNLPPEFWCESIEAAEQCDVMKQCMSNVWSGRKTADPVSLTLYYESLCPDCRNFWKNQLYSTYTQLGSIMNLTLVPYGNAREQKNGTAWSFTCQHGSSECFGNVIETCAINIVKNITVYFPFIHCMEVTDGNILATAKKCAEQFPVPIQQILNCSTSPQGNSLEHAMAAKTEALQPPHKYVPWVTLNGVHTEKIENKADKHLAKLICETYKGDKPAACDKTLGAEELTKRCLR